MEICKWLSQQEHVKLQCCINKAEYLLRVQTETHKWVDELSPSITVRLRREAPSRLSDRDRSNINTYTVWPASNPAAFLIITDFIVSPVQKQIYCICFRTAPLSIQRSWCFPDVLNVNIPRQVRVYIYRYITEISLFIVW